MRDYNEDVREDLNDPDRPRRAPILRCPACGASDPQRSYHGDWLILRCLECWNLWSVVNEVRKIEYELN